MVEAISVLKSLDSEGNNGRIKVEVENVDDLCSIGVNWIFLKYYWKDSTDGDVSLAWPDPAVEEGRLERPGITAPRLRPGPESPTALGELPNGDLGLHHALLPT